VNYEFFDNQKVESAAGLVGELRGGNRPVPTRGAPLCTFKEISRQIAGFVDDRPESRTGPASGVPTEAGVRLARAKGQSAPGIPPTSDASSGEQAEQAAAANTGAIRPTSAHDAPLSTADSDPAAPRDTATKDTATKDTATNTATEPGQGELFGKGE
jgi:NADH-quinone oxidoreductase subunit E